MHDALTKEILQPVRCVVCMVHRPREPPQELHLKAIPISIGDRHSRPCTDLIYVLISDLGLPRVAYAVNVRPNGLVGPAHAARHVWIRNPGSSVTMRDGAQVLIGRCIKKKLSFASKKFFCASKKSFLLHQKKFSLNLWFLREPFTGFASLRLVGWLVGWLAGWLVGWLAGWLAGWLVGWLVGWWCGLLVG